MSATVILLPRGRLAETAIPLRAMGYSLQPKRGRKRSLIVAELPVPVLRDEVRGVNGIFRWLEQKI